MARKKKFCIIMEIGIFLVTIILITAFFFLLLDNLSRCLEFLNVNVADNIITGLAVFGTIVVSLSSTGSIYKRMKR